jgi:hypothetical protein
MEPTLEHLLALPTKRLLAYYKVHRFDAEIYESHLIEAESEVGYKITKEDIDEIAEIRRVNGLIKAELDKREHIA